MSRPKRWYDPDAAAALRVVSRIEYDESWNASKWRHPRIAPRLGECLVYPLKDGPGLGLLVFLPPIMWVLSLPVYDVVSYLSPMTRADWALGLLIVPIMLPMIFSFLMSFGYALLFLGHVLVSSSLGENDHPRWPEWHPSDISEGIVRWVWAGLFGAAIGGGPLFFFYGHRIDMGAIDGSVFLGLIVIGVGYAQMALAASLLHDNLIAANPVTVITAIVRIGWDYLHAALISAVVLLAAGAGLWALLYQIPTMWAEAIAIWAFWFFLFYGGMVVMRMVGLTYHAHAAELHWFRRRPRWASSRRDGRIYANS